MRQDTAPQLATRLRSWDTGPRAVYTCQQSQFLANCQHQQVNRTGTSAASGKGKEASGGRDIIIRQDGKTEGGARPIRMPAFRRKNGRLYARPHNGGSAGSLQRSGFRENPTNCLTFVARSVRDSVFRTNRRSIGEM